MLSETTKNRGLGSGEMSPVITVTELPELDQSNYN